MRGAALRRFQRAGARQLNQISGLTAQRSANRQFRQLAGMTGQGGH